ncbi:hypothetical protein HGRIS_004503 [Hohenbuehelia grisea]|uniref:Zn(2)-C6 fungal-type domain-containing protein n=1 Tax=Hohenbuehelia grisea TaxID=104357 RepID=A0ABR3JC10_9AGAR
MAYRSPSDDDHDQSPSPEPESQSPHHSSADPNELAATMVPAGSSSTNSNDGTPDSPTDRGSARGTPNRVSVDLPRSAIASKGGCWTCRLRRKKCDEQREGDSCRTCIRLKITCLGWGPKRPDWMRDKAAVEKYKADIKAQLTRAGLIRGQPRTSFASSSGMTLGMGPGQQSQQQQQTHAGQQPHMHHQPSHGHGVQGISNMHRQQRGPYHRHSLPETSGAGPSSYVSPPLDFGAAFPSFDQHGRGGGGGAGHPPQFTHRPHSSIMPGMPGGSNSIFDIHPATYVSDPSILDPFLPYSPSGSSSQPQFVGQSSTSNPGSLAGTPSIGGTTPSLGGTASLAGTPGISGSTANGGLPFDFASITGDAGLEMEFPPVAPLQNPQPESAVQTDHVIWYFDRVRRLQFAFAGNSVTNITYSLIVLEPRGAVTNAVCALASLHYTQLRVAQGLEPLDPNPEFSTARYFHDEALCQLINAKEVRGHYVDADAIAALHLVSFSLFSGGATPWRRPLGIACDWLTQTALVNNENPKVLLLSMQPIEQLIVKTTMWFDIFASIAQQQPPRFFTLWKRLLSDRSAFWSLQGSGDLNMPPSTQTGLQMDALSGCPDEALLALAETAALAHWKAKKQAEGALSVRELVRRGDEIEATLRANVSELSITSTSDAEAPLHAGLTGSTENNAGQGSPVFPGEDMRRLVADVFRESAALYIHSVVNDPNPGVPEISAAVDTVVHLLQQLPASDIDRALVLPICLAGCLTDNSPLRDFLKGRLQTRDEGFGNVMQTRLLMESVWRKRDVGGGVVDWRHIAGERGPSHVPLLV